jgi:peptidoglycan/LPS O-acetylase OafA/YrhL
LSDDGKNGNTGATTTRQRPKSPAENCLLLSTRRLPELDGLRGIACGLVVAWHCLVLPADSLVMPTVPAGHNSILSWIGVPLSQIMVGGVDLFFVLSGFLIVGILMDHRGADNYFRVFWSRRVLRIFPVYFLLLATYVVALAVDGALHVPALDVWLISDKLPTWPYFLFLQNYSMAMADDVGSYWVGITWSLAVEEQFYLLIPLLVFVLNRKQVLGLALACVVLAPVIRSWPGTSFSWMYFATPSRMDALMFGVIVACLVRSERALNVCRTWRYALDVLALAVLAVFVNSRAMDLPRTFSFTLLAIMFAYCILRIFLFEKGLYRWALRFPALVWLGGISYPLYMYHQAANGLVNGFLFGAAPAILNWKGLATALLVLAIAVSLAALSTRYFERPFRAKGSALKYSFDRERAASLTAASPAPS